MTAHEPRRHLLDCSILLIGALTLVAAGCSRGPEATAVPAQPPLAPLTPEVRSAAEQRGRTIVSEAFSLLSSNLQSAMRQGGVSNALPYCSLSASPLTSGLAARHGVTIRRVTHKPRNATDRADDRELAILEQFRGGIGGPMPPAPIVTNLTAGAVSFFMPIVLTNELCLKCHGEPEKDITIESLAVIRRLYPGDEATGFKLGDLRGAWRIDLPLKTNAPPSARVTAPLRWGEAPDEPRSAALPSLQGLCPPLPGLLLPREERVPEGRERSDATLCQRLSRLARTPAPPHPSFTALGCSNVES